MAQLHRHAPADHSPKSPAPTVEQLLRESSKGSPSSSKHWDAHDDHGHHHKKSVLTKVKEKAKKLRHSLSKKKHDDNSVPSLLEDEDDEDTEYLGAPMYESELAPEQYKEKARQNPRTNAISDKHALPSSRDKETSLSPSKSHIMAAHAPAGPSITPDYTVTPSFPSKFLGLSIEPPELATSSSPTKVSSATSSPKSPKAKTASKTFHDASMPPQGSGRNGYGDQIRDKGVLMKEYLMNKFEPGEDDRALSQVISDAISPRRAPEDKGVMEKFRDAVTSLLGNESNEEPSQSAAQTPLTQRTSSEIPVSTNAYEADEEEEHGRILQAN